MIKSALDELPKGCQLIIDGKRVKYIDLDVLEILHEFNTHGSKTKHIQVELKHIPDLPSVQSGH